MKVMKRKDKAYEEFAKALKRLPPPLTCFSDGAACPWCGALHETVTFGKNVCRECERQFFFGYPDWHEGKDPISWVDFPWAAFYALGSRADLLTSWEPNARLRHLYFQKSEEKLGVSAHDNPKQ